MTRGVQATRAQAKVYQQTIEGKLEPVRKEKPLRLLPPATPYEDEEQARLFQEIDKHVGTDEIPGDMPDLKWVYHIPNGGWRGWKAGAKMRCQGVRPGVPDIAWDCMRRNPEGGWYAGFRCEMKRKGEYPTTEQKQWHAWLRSQGYYVCVCRTWREAWAELMAYRNLPAAA